METKLGKGIIITISILIVLVISIFIYILYQGRIINDLNLKINEKKLNAEILNSDKSKTEVAEKIEDNKNVETDVKNEEYKALTFNENSVVGKKSNVHYRNFITGVDFDIKKIENNILSLIVSDGAFKAKDKAYKDSVKEIRTSKNISEVFSGGIGQGVNGSLLVFLLEDGSVEYINLFNAVEKNDFSVKKIPELHNIVKFYNVLADDEVTGWGTILAHSTDGKIYDLDDFIEI